MKDSRLPSILSFSMVLLFLGGKSQMRSLLMRLARGGRNFYEGKVKRGQLFRTTALFCNHIYFSKDVLSMYERARSRYKNQLR